MNQAVVHILLVTSALTVLLIAATRLRGPARVFIIAQVVYWSLSYVARPAILLWVEPIPKFADTIADPRLANIGYDHGITEVLRPVIYGLFVYTAAVVAYAAWAKRQGNTQQTPYNPNLLPTLWTAYGIGIVARLAAFVTGTTPSAGQTESPHAVIALFTQLASLGALGMIVFSRPANRRITITLLSGLVGIELIWTIVVQSKTPILGAALALAVRFALTGWTRARTIGILAVSFGALGAFGWLQSFKESADAKAQSDLVSSGYPPIVQPILSILRRFDLLEAATDAYYMDGRQWLPYGDVLRNMLNSFVPAQLLGAPKFQSGTAWAYQVRGSSVDMTTNSVSLAEGNINEGFVLGGYVGVTIGVLFTFALLVAWSRSILSSRIVFVALGLSFTEVPALFERGMLGSVELLGKSLQVSLVVWLIYLMISEFRNRSKRATPPMPGKHADQAVVATNRGINQWI